MANELTKSFCLSPTTVFVLFYFSTWLAAPLKLRPYGANLIIIIIIIY